MNKIDRSNVDFMSDSDICNIGYYEEEIDNYPLRIEVFSYSGVDTATVFIDEEKMTEEKLKELLKSNNIIEFIQDKSIIDTFIDPNDNKFIVLNIPLRDKEIVYNELKVSLKDYEF